MHINFQILTFSKPVRWVSGDRMNYYFNFYAGLEFKEKGKKNWTLKVKAFHRAGGRRGEWQTGASGLNLHSLQTSHGPRAEGHITTICILAVKKPNSLDSTAWKEHAWLTTSLSYISKLAFICGKAAAVISSPFSFFYKKHIGIKGRVNGM